MHVPAGITVTVETARGDVQYTSLPYAPHGEGDCLVCTAQECGGPDLPDVWVLNGLIFADRYDISNIRKP